MRLTATKGIIYLTTTKAAEFSKMEKVAVLLEEEFGAATVEVIEEELSIVLGYLPAHHTVREIKTTGRELIKEV